MLEENKTIKELLEYLDELTIFQVKDLYDELLNKSLENIDNHSYDNLYTEIHHIVPKCIGGLDIKSNLIKLTVSDHIKAHILLSKMYPDVDKLKYAMFAVTLYSKKSSPERINTILSMDISSLSKIREQAVKARIGKKLPIEVRKKLSESHKGNKNPNYGKHRDEETRKKISESHKVENLSEESRKRLSNSKKGENHPMFGKILSEETRKKMSESKKGEKNHFFGKHHTEETKAKLSALNKGKKIQTEESKKRISEGNKGKLISKETRDKISNSRKGITFSEETRKKMSDAKKNKKVVIDSSGIILGNLKEASKLIGVSIPTLKKWIEKFPEKGFRFLNKSDI